MVNLLTRVSLSSWDEAWYGVISRNILVTKDIFNLSYNANPFYDHPPFVFWLQAICMKLFGISDFSVRLPSFLLGIGTLIVIYLLGKKVFGKFAGLFSALALVTSPWFLSRSLSGNLDTPLTFLFVLTFYLAIISVENKKYLIPAFISLALLFLTKSLVPFTILPVLLVVYWKKVSLRLLIIPTLISLVIILPWFVINSINNPLFINKYLSIGYPGVDTGTDIIGNILLTKKYLHNGMGNWFWWGFFSIVFGFLLYRKKYLPIVVFIAVFLFPFAFSNKGHIWHLLPLHPFWILSFFGLIELVFKKYKLFVMLVLLIIISVNQVKRNWYEIINIPRYITDIEILSTKAKDYDLPFFLDDDAVPEAVWYSQKDRVERIPQKGEIAKMFKTDTRFLLLTREWRLKEENIKVTNYELIAKDRDKVLILSK